jgi:hypothetical protein
VSDDADSPFAPLFLLADSQLLFAGTGGPSILERVRRLLPSSPRAAYLGAANGDDPAFYDLFAAAMDGAGITERRLVGSLYGDDDRAWLAAAHLVVLSGGDVERGWRIFEQSGIREALHERYAAGAVLLGVSAGAVHLGWDYLHLVPARIGAHAEADGWSDLRRRMAASKEPVRGLGIPTGGGLVVHPDGAAEAVRRPVTELAFAGDGDGEGEADREGEIRESLLLPPVADDPVH